MRRTQAAERFARKTPLPATAARKKTSWVPSASGASASAHTPRDESALPARRSAHTADPHRSDSPLAGAALESDAACPYRVRYPAARSFPPAPAANSSAGPPSRPPYPLAPRVRKRWLRPYKASRSGHPAISAGRRQSRHIAFSPHAC
ncbi:hypothetical protein SDC9_122205 [bioreactor metagenome]|uniref:Uncharacterized protein n=1 Tax=bioreactor metagenome TaxID=1076179 RepID=A0A645CE68_9ZZZZ